MNVKSYKDLTIWNKGIDLVKLIYEITEKFPRKEMFGITNQMRRSALSIPSNIAEGQARNYTSEFIQFLHQSLGSLAELETQTIVSCEIGFINNQEKEKVTEKIFEIQKMAYGLLKALVHDEKISRHSPLIASH